MARIWIALGALSGLLAVGLSAWAAHAPFAAAPERARLLSQALTMQGWHALALLAVGPLLGCLAMLRLGRSPLAARLAGGRG